MNTIDQKNEREELAMNLIKLNEEKEVRDIDTQEVLKLKIERNAYAQELFESNRYNAFLSQEKQKYLDQVNHLSFTLEEKDRYISSLLTEIENILNKKNDLANEIYALQIKRNNLKNKIDQSHKEKAILESKIKVLKSQLVFSVSLFEKSRSWKMTSPLRKIRKFFLGSKE